MGNQKLCHFLKGARGCFELKHPKVFLPPLGLKGMPSNLKILPSGVGGASSSEKCHFCVAVCFSKFSVAKSIANAHVWDNGKSEN